MIEPGAIYKTKDNGWIFIAVEIAHEYPTFTAWFCRRLDIKNLSEHIIEDYWLEKQERLT